MQILPIFFSGGSGKCIIFYLLTVGFLIDFVGSRCLVISLEFAVFCKQKVCYEMLRHRLAVEAIYVVVLSK